MPLSFCAISFSNLVNSPNFDIDMYDDIARDSIIKLGGFEEGRYVGKEFLYAQIKDEPQLMNYLALAQFKNVQDGENLKYIDEIKRGLEYPIDTPKVNELFGKLNMITPNIINEDLYKRVFELALNNPDMEDQKYTLEQLNDLRDIALRCPFTEGNAVYLARVILHGLFPDEEFYNYCDFAKKPDRKSSERHAIDKEKQQDILSEKYKTYQIVPNPNNGSFHMYCPNNEQILYAIYDSKGKKIIENLAIPNSNLVDINLNEVSSGLFVLVITNSNETISLKFHIIKD